jgi:hypothetical protein
MASCDKAMFKSCIRQHLHGARRCAVQPGAAQRGFGQQLCSAQREAGAREAVYPPQANHEWELTERQLSAHHLQRGRQLRRSEPQRELLS